MGCWRVLAMLCAFLFRGDGCIVLMVVFLTYRACSAVDNLVKGKRVGNPRGRAARVARLDGAIVLGLGEGLAAASAAAVARSHMLGAGVSERNTHLEVVYGCCIPLCISRKDV